MTIALIVWNVVLTALVLYVVAGYLWHINKVHAPDNVRGGTRGGFDASRSPPH